MNDTSYTGQDITILIPTKDRPEKMKTLLTNLIKQTVDFKRIIVVASGQSVEDTVMNFTQQLPVEYYHCDPPGQIRQRNMGISLLDEKTKLVVCLDDDIVPNPDAFEKMLEFWNQIPSETAGVSFNIVNEESHQHSWIKGFLRLSIPEPGVVMPSGINTRISNIKKSIQSQWLSGGLTVWKKEILENHKHTEINTTWAPCEDIIFSYPISKHYPLYVCADAHVRHEHEFSENIPKKFYHFRGRTNALWHLYFVHSNKDLSIKAYLWATMMTVLGGCIKALFKPNRRQSFSLQLGRLEGCIVGISTLIQKKDLTLILSDQIA